MSMRDYVSSKYNDAKLSIMILAITTNNFKLNTSITRIIEAHQFLGAFHESPHAHLDKFLHIFVAPLNATMILLMPLG